MKQKGFLSQWNIMPWPGENRSRFFFLILILAEIILSFTSFGFIRVRQISITTLQIPVILGTVLIGLPEGLFLSLLFGLFSMFNAIFMDKSPLDVLFRNPLLSVAPRILIPVAAWASYKAVRMIAEDYTLSAKLITCSFAAMCGSVSNTVFVLLALILLYPKEIGISGNLSASTIVVSNLIARNVMYEILFSAAAMALAILLMERFRGKTAVQDVKQPVSIRKTFQKWFLVFIVLTFFAMLVFVYKLLTKQDQENAGLLLSEKAYDVARQVSSSQSSTTVRDLKVGKTGTVLLIEDGIIIKSEHSSQKGKSAEDLGLQLDQYTMSNMFFAVADGVPGACVCCRAGDITVLAFLPEAEIYAERNQNAALLLLGLMLLFVLLYATISALVKQNVVQKIVDVNNSLEEIRNGNLNEKVTVTGNAEFAELSLGINSTVDALKATMDEISDRNQKELRFAREVQYSSLPAAEQVNFPGGVYEILGDMKTAREVGGDFYDYFLIGEDRLGFVIADVSGKGIPAALFMMKAKTLVRNYVLSGNTPAEALYQANIELCEHNETNMFVTVWLGILDIREGELEFANAAHNPPLLKRKREPFAYMDHRTYRRSLALGAMENTVYHNNRISFTRGDILFLYTDGVTEATSPRLELYGEDRLYRCLTANYSFPPKELIEAVHKDIDRFVYGAEQFDDITMVILKMKDSV